MSYLEVSDIIYRDVIDSFISEILKYESLIFASWLQKILDREIHTFVNTWKYFRLYSNIQN